MFLLDNITMMTSSTSVQEIREQTISFHLTGSTGIMQKISKGECLEARFAQYPFDC